MLDLFAMALLLTAWPPANCPHMIAKPVKAEVTSHNLMQCGAGANVNVGGISVRTEANQCPLFVIVSPAHAESESRAGSNTYTVPAGQLPVKRLDFMCHKYWLLGIIPIIVSSACEKISESTAGTVTHYEQRPCAIVEPPLETQQ